MEKKQGSSQNKGTPKRVGFSAGFPSNQPNRVPSKRDTPKLTEGAQKRVPQNDPDAKIQVCQVQYDLPSGVSKWPERDRNCYSSASLSFSASRKKEFKFRLIPFA